jgi:hypothetical protein
MEGTFERAAAITYASAEAKLLTRAPNSLSTTLDTGLTLLVARAVRQGSPGLTPTALRHRLDLPLDQIQHIPATELETVTAKTIISPKMLRQQVPRFAIMGTRSKSRIRRGPGR